MRCYIIDDQSSAIRMMKGYVSRTSRLELVGSATSSEQALKDIILGQEPVDLTFMDIDMPGINGLELARMIGGKSMVVFTTAHRSYGPEAFELKALDYLLKPVTYPRFLQSVETALALLAQKQDTDGVYHKPYTFVPGDGRRTWVKIMNVDILYLKADSNYVHIIMGTGTRLSYMSMEQAMSLLPGELFFRVHRSYIINLDKVQKIDASSLKMVNGDMIPIGRTYKQDFTRRISCL